MHPRYISRSASLMPRKILENARSLKLILMKDIVVFSKKHLLVMN